MLRDRRVERHARRTSAPAVAEDLIRYGDRISRSVYAVASQTVLIDSGVLTGASATIGIGDGRFNMMSRLSRDVNLGLSLVVPGPIPIPPTWVNVLNAYVDENRFALSVGTSYRF